MLLTLSGTLLVYLVFILLWSLYDSNIFAFYVGNWCIVEYVQSITYDQRCVIVSVHMSERILIGHGSFYIILNSVYTVIYKIMYVRLHTSFKGYIVIHINKYDDDTTSFDNNDSIHVAYINFNSYDS